MPKKESKEKEIIQTFNTELKQYQQTNQSHRDEINDIYNAYIGNMDLVKKVPYFEPISIPKLRTEVAYIVPYIFSGQPEVEVEGVGPEDKTLASILERIANFRIQTIPQAYEKIEAWVKQSVTFGTSIIKVNWKFTTEPIPGEEGYERPTYDGPELDVPNILDCYYNPILPDIYCQNSMIFRSVLSVKEVKENPAYNFKGEKGLNRELVKPKENRNERENSSRMGDSEGLDAKTISEGTVEIYERLTQDTIQTLARGEEDLVLRDEKIKGLNAIKLTHEPNCIPNRFDGYGVGQNTLGLSKGYHSIVNQTKTNITLGNNPMFYGRKGANISKKDLVATPGGFIEVEGEGALSNDFAQVEFQDIKQGALEFINLLDDEHKRASGANDIIQGGSSNKTLGQDELSTTNSANRFELIQRRFKQSLSDLVETLLRMELENLQSPDAEILRIFEDEIEQVNPMTGEPEMVGGLRQQIYELLINEAKNIKFNVSIKGETTVARNKDVQIKQLMDWYEMFGVELPPANKVESARKILELRGIDEVDSLVPTAEEMNQLQQEVPAISGEPTQQGINQSV